MVWHLEKKVKKNSKTIQNFTLTSHTFSDTCSTIVKLVLFIIFEVKILKKIFSVEDLTVHTNKKENKQ